MNKYTKYRPKTKEVKPLYAQDLCVQKTERENFRLNSDLKKLVETECKNKSMTKTDFYTNLALWYFQKRGKVNDYKKKERLVYGVDWEL